MPKKRNGINYFNFMKMEYYINIARLKLRNKAEIECELQLGDYCSIETDTGFVELKVIKRTYHPIVEHWVFWCEIAINNDSE